LRRLSVRQVVLTDKGGHSIGWNLCQK
jgi:hypothetical protein